MPPIQHVPSERDYAARGYTGKKYDYDYPEGRNFSPSSELHERIKNAVLRRAQDSYDVMKRRHASWNLVDQTLTAYMPTDEKEKLLKEKDPRKPVSIVVPYSYATLETLLTYLTTAFLDLPILRYEGVTSEDTIGAIMLEKVIELQTTRFKAGLALHTQFRDSLAYGFGATALLWDQMWGFIREKQSDGTVKRVEKMLFEGTRMENLDPYCYLPDPTIPVHQVQKGEFVGWIDRTNLVSLLDIESTFPSDFFNVRYLLGQDGTSVLFGTEQSKRGDKTGITSRGTTVYDATTPVDVVYMYVRIIPSDEEWKLGSSDYPEKWVFGVAADQYVIMAKKLDLDHNLFPVTICAPDFDGYSVAPVGRIELIYGMQHVLDFLFSSHIANVRKAINDMLLVDPFLVNMADLEEPGPGKLVKMRRAAWGRGVKDAVQQLAVVDVTKSHISQDVPSVVDLIQRTSAAVDSLMGIMRPTGERRSATEARDARMSALSRLAKAAKIASMMTIQDLAYMYASHTQQLMTADVYVRTMGRYQTELEEEYGFKQGMKVTPSDLLINYDVLMHDGTVEIGERADTWVQLFQILATQPAVGAGFDIVRVFKHIARMLGAKNLNEFVQRGGSLKVQTLQDEVVRTEAARGNIVPLKGPGLGGEGEGD